MDSLPTIPTPLPQLWREIRIRIMPVATFTCVIAALFLMWRQYVIPSSIIGTAEVIQANITASEDGVLTALTVDNFENVTRDQVVGVLTPMEDDVLKASLAIIESDAKLNQKTLDTDLARNLDAYIRLKAELATERKDLANSEVQ
jgi:multidrug resistance efflux pump